MNKEKTEKEETRFIELLEECREKGLVSALASDYIPVWEKRNLTIKEASQLFGIGMNKLYNLVKDPGCNYVLYVGSKAMIKRVPFENYLDANTTYSI